MTNRAAPCEPQELPLPSITCTGSTPLNALIHASANMTSACQPPAVAGMTSLYGNIRTHAICSVAAPKLYEAAHQAQEAGSDCLLGAPAQPCTTSCAAWLSQSATSVPACSTGVAQHSLFSGSSCSSSRVSMLSSRTASTVLSPDHGVQRVSKTPVVPAAAAAGSLCNTSLTPESAAAPVAASLLMFDHAPRLTSGLASIQDTGVVRDQVIQQRCNTAEALSLADSLGCKPYYSIGLPPTGQPAAAAGASLLSVGCQQTQQDTHGLPRNVGSVTQLHQSFLAQAAPELRVAAGGELLNSCQDASSIAAGGYEALVYELEQRKAMLQCLRDLRGKMFQASDAATPGASPFHEAGHLCSLTTVNNAPAMLATAHSAPVSVLPHPVDVRSAHSCDALLQLTMPLAVASLRGAVTRSSVLNNLHPTASHNQTLTQILRESARDSVSSQVDSIACIRHMQGNEVLGTNMLLPAAAPPFAVGQMHTAEQVHNQHAACTTGMHELVCNPLNILGCAPTAAAVTAGMSAGCMHVPEAGLRAESSAAGITAPPTGRPAPQVASCSNPMYKTELCRTWLLTGGCRYGGRCQFAHGHDDLRPLQRHPKYKTQPCRTFSMHGSCPYGNRCHFIHDLTLKAPDTALQAQQEVHPVLGSTSSAPMVLTSSAMFTSSP